jgi:predicted RNA-binding Zn-ribbon protein involved in translation (DUF1610 family)
MKHQKKTKNITFVLCGKCEHEFMPKGSLVKYQCPKCDHEAKYDVIF